MEDTSFTSRLEDTSFTSRLGDTSLIPRLDNSVLIVSVKTILQTCDNWDTDQSDEKTCPRYLRHPGVSETHEMIRHGTFTLTYKTWPFRPGKDNDNDHDNDIYIWDIWGIC